MKDRVEVVATVLLALAAVATAWSGYQATRWNGEQTKASSRTNAIRIDAARAQGKVRFQQFIDQLARHLQRGDSLARDLHDELYPEPDTFAHAAAQDAHGHDPRDSQP